LNITSCSTLPQICFIINFYKTKIKGWPNSPALSITIFTPTHIAANQPVSTHLAAPPQSSPGGAGRPAKRDTAGTTPAS
jgi:hypothetical protein